MPRWSPFEPYFWSLVKITNGCWLWQGDTSHGYGRIWKGKRRYAAHRVAYELSIGPIPDGMFACHHCDNRLCVNPAHIFIGTQKDNMQDWTKKGKNILINHPERLPRGKNHYMKKNTKFAKSHRKKIANLRREEWREGKRIAIRDNKGRIMGTRMRP